MTIAGLTNSGAIPALEMLAKFAGQRQRLLAHNIANVSTPDFVPLDVSTGEFRRALGEAIDKRRASGGQGALAAPSTREVRVGADGRVELSPRTPSGNILFHDRNNRDVERLMQDQAENLAAFRVATDLLRTRTDLLRSALAQRV
ncbi:MAG: hypothetical protein HRU70_12645 [Phycisphaeraceae bacterium]|nr:MAG: hypothetical protein HRU70_12645 [Phycisphaeraceae bacterium]